MPYSEFYKEAIKEVIDDLTDDDLLLMLYSIVMNMVTADPLK